MPNCKYTAEVLRPIFESSLSYAEVLRRLGLKQTGGSQANIKRLAQKYGISTAHFLGQARNRGNAHRGGPGKATAEEILVLRDPLAHPEKAYKLRRAMIETGIPFRCALCGIGASWNGKPLMLTIDHINGRRNDNRRENLRFLCPNCHSQTPTFGNSLGLTDVTTCKRRYKYYWQKRKRLAV
ncbi:MAG TPA: HNH endonuclease signature motif containing protein [Blastocatellia bacterium]|nr:HNH endonuclease signature motif containing protein [Blastocatellia bacterium]